MTVSGFSVQAIVRVYDLNLNAGKAGRALLKGLPLFALDVAFNGFFQYRSESDLPTGLRLGRATVGGLGNAIISLGVGVLAGAAITELCVATVGLGCVLGVGATALGVDFGLNWAFDTYGKERLLERFWLERSKYDQIKFHKVVY